MQHPADIIEESNAAALSAPSSGISLGERIIAAISCTSESGIDIRRLKLVLLSGLAVLTVFGIASYGFPNLSGASRIPLSFQIFNLVLVSFGALGLTRLGRYWRWWTLSFCIILIINLTIAGIAIDEDDPVLMALFALIITSAVTIPWNARWQSALGLAAFGSFSVSTMIGVVEENDLRLWGS